MAKFRIQTHGRLQEWVAEEKGYFADEGLDYDFVTGAGRNLFHSSVRTTESNPLDIRRGAFESFEEGRACEVSSACHWAINMASSGEHGRMWGHCYSVTQSGVMVPPESPLRRPEDLAGVEIGVGYHSGSHFSALQGLTSYLPQDQIKLSFIGSPNDRLKHMLDRSMPAANVFSTQFYILEQQGFRKVLDTTFMIGFMVDNDANLDDVAKYFRALERAQSDIDLEPEKYKHYFVREIDAAYHDLIDVRLFGTGERLVFEPYTREMFETTHRWMIESNIFSGAEIGQADYAQAVLA
ncbi:MAG TPA: hypothetical protein VFS62_14150 [Chloroflexota bacterium]|nr:hypothetical protein [Chloroflexota bacterium]